MEKGHTIKVLDHGYVRYLDHMGDDRTIVQDARTSYDGESKGLAADIALLEYLYLNKHTSPFEMAKFKFEIKMPIFVARQYIRHRMQNFNEVSARYTQLPSEFYIPKEWRAQDTLNKQSSVVPSGGGFGDSWSAALSAHCGNSYRLYEEMMSVGIAREMARMVLPLNIYTRAHACWDLKNLIHFITLRDDSHAQAEIQEYGKAIKAMVTELFPYTMAIYNRRGWIQTSVKQPKIEGNYLCLFKFKSLAGYCLEVQAYRFNSGWTCGQTPDFWRPIPEHPLP